MKLRRMRFSLRYKLLLLLTVLPLLSLGLYLFMATNLFQRDKIAYVFDSSATVTRSLATQTRTELISLFANLRNIVEDYDFGSKSFSPSSLKGFERNPWVKALILFRKDERGQIVELGRLKKEEAVAQQFFADSGFLEVLKNSAATTGAHILESPMSAGNAGVSFRMGEANDPHFQVVVALYQADDLVTAFGLESIYKSFLVKRSGEVLVGGSSKTLAADLEALKGNLNSKSPEGTAEIKSAQGRAMLASYASIGVGDLMVTSFVDKRQALKAVDVLISKSLLFFISLLATTVLISIFASGKLTYALSELFEATNKISRGDFDIHIENRSHDEVGGLATNFNAMAAEVSRLLDSTAEKARMESELHTVRTVQETLFPPASTQFGPLRIVGHFEPASECGGDWWNYTKVGNRIFLWIGDATGHGAPAALITSAACSAANVISGIDGMSPGRALSILNKAIYKTAKGQIMMTFFIACIDLDKNELSYANASHENPFLMRSGAHGRITKSDLIPLMEVNGPRLGDVSEFEFQDSKLPIHPGDQIFFYTDGILDIKNQVGKKWNERLFLNAMMKCANLTATVDEKMTVMRSDIEEYREGTELIDDVTMVMCQYEVGAA